MATLMYFQYGSYRHDEGEVELANMTRQLIRSRRGQVQFIRHGWTIRGEKLASSQSQLLAKLAQLEAAYSVDNRDAGLYTAGGTRFHYLPSAGAVGGVQVIGGVNYPIGRGAEGGTYRTYEIQLQADYPVLQTTLLEFRETLEFIGNCGPEYVYTELPEGPPRRQIVRQQTLQQVLQSGTAIGFYSYPSIPDPLWPSLLDSRPARNQFVGPEVNNGDSHSFGVSWSYSFTSPVPLNGRPTVRL